MRAAPKRYGASVDDDTADTAAVLQLAANLALHLPSQKTRVAITAALRAIIPKVTFKGVYKDYCKGHYYKDYYRGLNNCQYYIGDLPGRG